MCLVPKTAAVVSLPLRPRASGATRLRWLYDEIRLGIVEGRLAPGSRLPSTRSIARHYRVARGTVVAAFDHLIAEGYVEGSVGIGTFVRRTSPGPAAESCTRIHAPSVAPLSAGGQRLASHPFPLRLPRPPEGDFRLDFPALDAFSVNTWRRLAARALRAAPCDLLGHGEPLGYRPLRAAICGYFGQTRGVKCAVEQVVITGGTQQSLDLIARLVLDPGDPVWMEDPGYAAATSLLRGHGAEVALRAARSWRCRAWTPPAA
jgi:GntR family transcriptional regulator/MocR family aminotransferase